MKFGVTTFDLHDNREQQLVKFLLTHISTNFLFGLCEKTIDMILLIVPVKTGMSFF
ncbi:hypothetical protein AQPE_1477 [Aquipluma nitroreducens]|uniref:Uncharacterized protein n=1 Tax=Aquipluma nitroreducens TaxID=2010828 RepID=A0A5K7S6Y7_9BACT|nr:hypothetical protein AQPE_1477 [Aquipluma nitroreducens]